MNNPNKGKCDLLKAQVKSIGKACELLETLPASKERNKALFDLGFTAGYLEQEAKYLWEVGEQNSEEN